MKFSEFPQQVVKENVNYTVKEITNVIKKYGPRESGNENCLAAQKHMKKELDNFCDETHFEEYKMAPKAFLFFTKYVSLGIIAVVVVFAMLTFTNVLGGFFIPHIVVASAIGVGLLITAIEFLFYKQFTDMFHKKITAHNLVATRKPTGEVKKRIVISGHCDAAYEWRHIYYFKGRGMTFFMFGTIFLAIISFVIAIVSAVLDGLNVSGAFADFVVNYSYYFHFLTALFMITLFFFVDFKTISPGANDNLTGTYAALCSLKMLEEANVNLEHTEVVCMITDGEEAGLRGAKQFAKDHYKEYVESGVETAVLCVDTLTDINDFYVYNDDMTGLVHHDKRFSSLVKDAADESNHKDLQFSKVYFGSSDAAAFTQEKITATCLAAMDPTPADYYHNRRDTADRLVPEALKKGYDVVISTILKFDRDGLNKAE